MRKTVRDVNIKNDRSAAGDTMKYEWKRVYGSTEKFWKEMSFAMKDFWEEDLKVSLKKLGKTYSDGN